jgi:Flp pilus assembly protein TadG
MRRRSDEGSAPAEFALVGGLLVVVFLAIVQLAVAVDVRNSLVAAAAEGARVAAQADESLADGVARTRDVVSSSLSPSYAREVSARRVEMDGATVVVVRIRAPLPMVGLAGPSGDLVVAAHALAEVP